MSLAQISSSSITRLVKIASDPISFTEVWKCKWSNNGQSGIDVLVRFTTLYCSNVSTVQPQVIQSFEALKNLSDPNVTSYLAYFWEPKNSSSYELGVVMALPTEGALCLNNSQVHDMDLCIRVMVGITKGLLYLHQNGIVHGDVRSENIFLDSNNSPKVTGYGLSGLLRTVVLQNIVRWLAPELISPNLTKESDIYALGMLFSEILQKKPPVCDLVQGTPTLSNQVPLHIRELVSKMVSLDKSLRPSIDKVLSCLTDNSSFTITGCHNGSISVFNSKSGEMLHTVQGHSDSVWALCPWDNQCFFSGSDDCKIMMWSVLNKSPEFTLLGHSHGVVSLSRWDTSTLLSGDRGGVLKIWDVPSRTCTFTIDTQSHNVRSIAKLNEQEFVTVGHDRKVKIWSFETKELKKTFEGHSSLVSGVAVLSPQSIASSSDDQSVKIWNVQTGQCTATCTGSAQYLNFVQTLNSNTIVTSGYDGNIRLYDSTGNVKATWNMNSSFYSGIVAGENMVLCGGNHCKLVDVTNGVCVHEYLGFSAPAKSVAIITAK